VIHCWAGLRYRIADDLYLDSLPLLNTARSTCIRALRVSWKGVTASE